MKFLLLSDIHGNIDALEAILREESENLQIINLGDVCGYYPFANECISLIRERNVISILGNHDLGVLQGSLTKREDDYRWKLARDRLDPDNFEWLGSLGISKSIDLGDLELHLHHGSPSDVDEYLYPDGDFQGHLFKEGITLLGHTHIQMIKHQNSSIIINPGSTGQPRNGRPGADYAILNLAEETIFFKHLDYDFKSLSSSSNDLISSNSAMLLSRIDESRFKQNPCGLGSYSLRNKTFTKTIIN
jgi:predicted phosphodiesterase